MRYKILKMLGGGWCVTLLPIGYDLPSYLTCDSFEEAVNYVNELIGRRGR